MSPFTPLRASPQASPEVRPKHVVPNLSSYDVTISSATSSTSAALTNLTPKDVKLIDEIIDRSPPSATTFLTVFKAYNEVLAEHNMDASNDVVYYKILLKLGVVKGYDWGTKWETVKAQMGYDAIGSITDEEPQALPRGPAMLATRAVDRRVTRSPDRDRRQSLQSLMRARTAALHRAHDVEPLQSFADSVSTQSYSESYAEENAEGTETETETQTQTYSEATEEQASADIAAPYSSPGTLISGGKHYGTKENALELSTDASSYPPLPSIDQFLPVHAKKAMLHSRPEINSDRDLPDERPLPRPFGRLPLQRNHYLVHEQPSHGDIPIKTSSPVRAPIPRSRTQVLANEDASVDEENSWKKIRLARDEKQADNFRKTALIKLCWTSWRRRLERLFVSSPCVRRHLWQILIPLVGDENSS